MTPKGANRTISLEVTGNVAKKPARRSRVSSPVLVCAAPHIYRRLGGSIDEFAEAWRVTPKQAQQFINMALIDAVFGPCPQPGRPKVVEISSRRVA